MEPRRLSSLIVLVVCLGLPLQSWSNPIMSGGWMSACQIDGTRHVVLSYTCGDPSNGSGSYCGTDGMTRDGQGITGKWETYSHPGDLGSGMSGMMYGGTLCDCNVAAGKREYRVPGSGPDAYPFDTSITVAQVGAAEGTWCEPLTSCDCSSAEETDEGGCAVGQSDGPNPLLMVLLLLGLVWARRRD